MKIASWNINGVKARIDAAQTWLRSASPDIACLQEIKCADEAFPRLEFEALGYNVAVHGQKGFNGVALLSKLPFEDITPRLAGDPDDVQARYLEACVSVPSGVLRIVNIYLPNGNPFGSEKFVYKLAWMTRLKERIRTLLHYEEPMVIAGDFNVIPAPVIPGCRHCVGVTCQALDGEHVHAGGEEVCHIGPAVRVRSDPLDTRLPLAAPKDVPQ